MSSVVTVSRHNQEAKTPPKPNACSCSSGSCCGSQAEAVCKPARKEPYIIGFAQSAAGKVPQVSTELAGRDITGAWKVRWGIDRMSYTVEPGLYCAGAPDESSPVLVTANYKLSFDQLRRELSGLSVWILVLDTKGVNVWCAAGKGTFGTDELLRRIEAVKLGSVVGHRTIILPQLGATGVAAHTVAKKSGFHVVFGPVRASDIRAFLKAGMNAADEMRAVNFTFADRLVLTPVEIVGAIKPLILFFGILFILNAAGLGHFGLTELIAFSGAVATGCILTPVLLPWIPGSAFSFKGALLGLIWAALLIFLNGWPQLGYLRAASFLLLLPSVSGYLAMNFTGCSTYTSPSGVNKEMRVAIPILLVAAFLGILLLLADCILNALH
ncbi:MAG: mercury methylation corrinoid protein HgcA [Clostridia bacterium]|nr:mercury methylation corrinoid protein HgcA [Clostridia bacterium]